MGKKRRIMTSGQKFIRKYRAWLDTTGSGAKDDIIDVEGLGKVVSALEVAELVNADSAKNQTITFNAFVDGKLQAANADKLDLFIDGTKVDSQALLSAGVDTGGPFTIGDYTLGDAGPGGKKAPLSRPDVVAARANQRLMSTGSNNDLNDGLTTGNPVVLAPGKHTLRALVHGEPEHTAREVEFTVERSVITTTVKDGEALMEDDNDGGDRNVLIALQHLEFSGSHAGVHETYAVAGAGGKGFKVEVLIKEDTANDFSPAEPNDGLVAGDWTAAGVLDADAGENKYPAGDLANFLKTPFAAPAAGEGVVAKTAIIRVIFTPKDAADELITKDATTFDHQISIEPA